MSRKKRENVFCTLIKMSVTDSHLFLLEKLRFISTYPSAGRGPTAGRSSHWNGAPATHPTENVSIKKIICEKMSQHGPTV